MEEAECILAALPRCVAEIGICVEQRDMPRLAGVLRTVTDLPPTAGFAALHELAAAARQAVETEPLDRALPRVQALIDWVRVLKGYDRLAEAGLLTGRAKSNAGGAFTA